MNLAPLAPVAGYLLGSVSFAVLVVKVATGKDVRDVGSGNAGATNVLRAAGKGAAVATILGDVGKGVAAVLIARAMTSDPKWIAASGLASVLGHVFPIFFGFRGGKGVATATGAFCTLAPWATLAVVPLFVGVVAVSRYVSLGSVVAAVALPVSCWLFFGPLSKLAEGSVALPRETVWAAAIAAVVVVGKHKGNIERLIRGEERRLGEKK